MNGRYRNVRRLRSVALAQVESGACLSADGQQRTKAARKGGNHPVAQARMHGVRAHGGPRCLYEKPSKRRGGYSYGREVAAGVISSVGMAFLITALWVLIQWCLIWGAL